MRIKQLEEKTDKLEKADQRHEHLNQESLVSVARIEASLIEGARKYFRENKFTEIVVPHITKATGSCENVATMFELEHLGERAYLCQTGQLYLEALIPKLGNVFCVGPSFRAEKPGKKVKDKRHLTEFTLIELEFPGDYKELLVHIEGIISRMIQHVIKKNYSDLEYLGIDIRRLGKIKPPFAKLKYAEACKLVAKEFPGFKFGDDLNHEKEMYLSSLYPHKPLFIMHYPEKIKFFNMRENDRNPEIVNSADLILPHSGEAVGAAERENRYDKLLKRLENSVMMKQLEKKGGSIKDFEWYLESVKHNGQLHSGCGIGLNRVTQFVLGASDIRVTTPYPMTQDLLL